MSLVLAVAICALSSSSASAAAPPFVAFNSAQLFALQLFVAALDGQNSVPLNASACPTTFAGSVGAACNADGSITHIHLPSLQLYGQFFSDLNMFPALIYLNVSNNSIAGTADAIAGAAFLQTLDLSRNRLSGDILSLIAENLTHLVVCRLQVTEPPSAATNCFFGSVPLSETLCNPDALDPLPLCNGTDYTRLTVDVTTSSTSGATAPSTTASTLASSASVLASMSSLSSSLSTASTSVLSSTTVLASAATTTVTTAAPQIDQAVESHPLASPSISPLIVALATLASTCGLFFALAFGYCLVRRARRERLRAKRQRASRAIAPADVGDVRTDSDHSLPEPPPPMRPPTQYDNIYVPAGYVLPPAPPSAPVEQPVYDHLKLRDEAEYDAVRSSQYSNLPISAAQLNRSAYDVVSGCVPRVDEQDDDYDTAESQRARAVPDYDKLSGIFARRRAGRTNYVQCETPLDE